MSSCVCNPKNRNLCRDNVAEWADSAAALVGGTACRIEIDALDPEFKLCPPGPDQSQFHGLAEVSMLVYGVTKPLGRGALEKWEGWGCIDAKIVKRKPRTAAELVEAFTKNIHHPQLYYRVKLVSAVADAERLGGALKSMYWIADKGKYFELPRLGPCQLPHTGNVHVAMGSNVWHMVRRCRIEIMCDSAVRIKITTAWQ